MNRAVAVFLWDLSILTPEHQRIWETKELANGNYRLHSDYYRTQIMAEFPERWSLCEAFIVEMRIINEMTLAIGKPTFFRTVYDSESRPREFTLMIRPTLKELNSFVHLLDKLISDNINKDFFRGDLDLEDELPRGDGRVEVRQKGTLRLLEEWLTTNVRVQDEQPIRDMLATFRRIRQMRQNPAHTVHEDAFDHRYFREQRELLHDAYTAVRFLRLIFANHPLARGVHVDEALYEGRIWPY